jgi:hypothetical protein
MKMFTCKFSQDKVTHQRLRVGSKKHAESKQRPQPFLRAERMRNT